MLGAEAPPDEFDLETKEICKRVRPGDTAVHIAQTISDVFDKCLDYKYSVHDLIGIAEQIEHIWKE